MNHNGIDTVTEARDPEAYSRNGSVARINLFVGKIFFFLSFVFLGNQTKKKIILKNFGFFFLAKVFKFTCLTVMKKKRIREKKEKKKKKKGLHGLITKINVDVAKIGFKAM